MVILSKLGRQTGYFLYNENFLKIKIDKKPLGWIIFHLWHESVHEFIINLSAVRSPENEKWLGLRPCLRRKNENVLPSKLTTQGKDFHSGLKVSI